MSKIDRAIISRLLRGRVNDGGKGSGNWGHKGRPGLRGGSGKGGGSHFRTGSASEGFKSAFRKQERALFDNARKADNYTDFWYSLSRDQTKALKDMGFDESEPGAIKTLYDKLNAAQAVRRSNQFAKNAKQAGKIKFQYDNSPETAKMRGDLKSALETECERHWSSRLFVGVKDDDEAATLKNAILSSVDKIDGRILPAVSQSFQNLTVDWSGGGDSTDKRRTAYYTEGTGTITIDIDNDRYRNPDGSIDVEEVLGTFWHEYGHFVDDIQKSRVNYKYTYGKGTGYEYDSSYVSGPTREDGRFNEACTLDAENLLKKAGLTDFKAVQSNDNSSPFGTAIMQGDQGMYNVQGGQKILDFDRVDAVGNAVSSLIKKELGYISDRDFFAQYGKPQLPEWSDYYEGYYTPKRNLYRERKKFKDSDERYRAAMDKYDADMDEWRATHDYDALVKQLGERYKQYERNKKVFERTSDILDAETGGTIFSLGVLYGGHGFDYYQKPAYGGVSNNQRETFANVFSILANGNTDALKMAAKFTPSALNVFMDTIDRMASGNGN